MPIYMTARFRVQPESVQTCLYAINDFVDHIKANEPGTLQYTSVQEYDDSFSFLNFFAFEDEAAEGEIEEEVSLPAELLAVEKRFGFEGVTAQFFVGGDAPDVG